LEKQHESDGDLALSLKEHTVDDAPISASLAPDQSEEPLDGASAELIQIPVETVEKITRQVMLAVRHEFHSGPMPSPKQLTQYNDALPGTALIIRDEFIANGQHTRICETTALRGAIEKDKRAQWMAFVLVLVGMSFALILALSNHETTACIIAGSVLVGIAAAFLNRPVKAKQGNDASPPKSVDDN